MKDCFNRCVMPSNSSTLQCPDYSICRTVVAVPCLAIMLGSAFKTRLFHPMQKIGFAEALDSIVTSDPRYQRDAYVFLRDALDFTTKQQKKIKGATVRHVPDRNCSKVCGSTR